MNKLSLSQDDIVKALAGPDPERRKAALQRLFVDSTLRKTSIAHVRRNGGNRQDGEDVFQEAIILFDRKLRLGAFRGQGTLEAYFMGIVRWHWFNERQRLGKGGLVLSESPPEPPPAGNPELEYLLAEGREQLEKLLALLNDKCRKILKMYQLDYSMAEIAHVLGFANDGVAKKEAFLCRERFRAVLKAHPGIWQDLYKSKRP